MNKHDAEQLISQLEGSYFSSDEKEEMKRFYLSSFVTDEMALKSNQWTRICEFGCPVMVWQEGLLTEEQAKETTGWPHCSSLIVAHFVNNTLTFQFEIK